MVMAIKLPQEMDMTATQALAFPEEKPRRLERAMYAFLVEKERRSGSSRTVEGYSRMLQDFFGRVRKSPDQVTAQESLSGPTARAFRQGPFSNHHRRSHGLPLFRSTVPHPDGHRRDNPCDRLGGPVHPPHLLGVFRLRKYAACWPSSQKLLRVSVTAPSSSF